MSEVRNICHKVNQSLLLNDLFENKSCNRLLEPESKEEVWNKRTASTTGMNLETVAKKSRLVKN